uniref:Uncharacterized protein n=1 Tax=Meloidogyne enterolobii TaxID=390850 RepID=A0A6V7VY49_MELEN|nr:unnamed protein product [Meloidogyne enterolobii]
MPKINCPVTFLSPCIIVYMLYIAELGRNSQRYNCCHFVYFA